MRSLRFVAASIFFSLLNFACHRAAETASTNAPAALLAAPPPLAPGAIRFAVIGDFGTGAADELAVARLVTSWNPAFILTVGDNNRPNGAPEDLEPHVANAYAQYIPGNHGAFGAGGPQRFFPTLGNHDWQTQDGLRAYLDFFQLPGRYYDQPLAGGRIELFALDSDRHEPDGNTPTSKQAQWLRERAAASHACLKLVTFHHPAYSSSEHGSSENMRWPFKEWGIGAVLAGHDHVYERLESQGIPYFVDGLGGAPIYDFKTPLPESKVRYNQSHGAMLITLSPKEARYEFWNVAGEKIDSLAVPIDCPIARSPAPGAVESDGGTSPAPAR